VRRVVEADACLAGRDVELQPAAENIKARMTAASARSGRGNPPLSLKNATMGAVWIVRVESHNRELYRYRSFEEPGADTQIVVLAN
jgi:hypothetical protein